MKTIMSVSKSSYYQISKVVIDMIIENGNAWYLLGSRLLRFFVLQSFFTFSLFDRRSALRKIHLVPCFGRWPEQYAPFVVQSHLANFITMQLIYCHTCF